MSLLLNLLLASRKRWDRTRVPRGNQYGAPGPRLEWKIVMDHYSYTLLVRVGVEMKDTCWPAEAIYIVAAFQHRADMYVGREGTTQVGISSPLDRFWPAAQRVQLSPRAIRVIYQKNNFASAKEPCSLLRTSAAIHFQAVRGNIFFFFFFFHRFVEKLAPINLPSWDNSYGRPRGPRDDPLCNLKICTRIYVSYR